MKKKLFNKLSEQVSVIKIKEKTLEESEIVNAETNLIYKDFVKDTNEKLNTEE